MATAYASMPGIMEQPRQSYSRWRPSSIQGHEMWRRWEALHSQQSSWLFDYQDIINYLCPYLDDVLEFRAPGQSRTEYIYDSRPLAAPITLAANMQGAVTNPALQWFRMRFQLRTLNELQHVNAWLEQCDALMLNGYNASNFYQASHTYYVHLGTVGTAAMFVAARRRAGGGIHLECQTLPVGSYCVAENSAGRIDTLYRECWFSPRVAYQHFGEGVSAATMMALRESSTMDMPTKYLHAVYPREDRRPNRLGNRNMPFVSCYLDGETKEIVQETGFEEFPFLVSRWSTLSKSPYGYGPGHMALPDVRVLNKLRQLNLDQLVLWAQPPLVITGREGVVGAISLDPYALNYEATPNALRTLDVTGRPDLVQITAAELMASINDLFFVNALQALPPPGAGGMTAFEVAQRLELMQRLMGPAFTRLLSEMLDPLADRVFGLFLRGRALPYPPMEVLEAAVQGDGQIGVEYEGPLARNQRGVDIQAIGQTLAIGAQIAQASQKLDVWENFDLDGMARRAAEVSGCPRSLVIDLQQMLRMRRAREAQQAALQQDANARENAKALPAVAETMQTFYDLGNPQERSAA